MAIQIEPIPAFKDNYIWTLIHREHALALCIDPGDAAPVEQFLQQRQYALAGILITHHHWDHTNGIAKLTQARDIPVWGPRDVQGVTHPLADGQHCVLPTDMGLAFDILAVPGHTLDHIAYYGHQLLFCGDTLFAGGCGRLFEGTAEQLYHSLQRLAALPPATEVYCAHEYTLANLRFAQRVEPDNVALQQRLTATEQLRAQHRPSLPSTIDLELATNPFLRVRQPAVIQAAERYANRSLNHPVAVFATLRDWKNHF
jgi:hydroxyacylglutathione hydrolase